MSDEVTIDGAFGEGGGQIVRTGVSLAAASGRPVRIENIRAARRRPGLAAQHLTAVRAAAAVCAAEVAGDALGARELVFQPRRPPQAGAYDFDVAAAREGGSAGAATLVLQTVLPPLALAAGGSSVTVRGGTHVPWSPPFDFVAEVWLPMLARLGMRAQAELVRWGFYPAGQGEIRAEIAGAGPDTDMGGGAPAPVEILARGAAGPVSGRAVAASLPAHIAQRMADRARALLREAGIDSEIEAARVRAVSPGAGIFLTAAFENLRAGFSAMGARGKPAEDVAEEAVAALVAHRESGAALDAHLGDQIVAVLALASGPSAFTVARVTGHLVTSAWVVERFGLARVTVEGAEGAPGRVRVAPAAGAGRG